MDGRWQQQAVRHQLVTQDSHIPWRDYPETDVSALNSHDEYADVGSDVDELVLPSR